MAPHLPGHFIKPLRSTSPCCVNILAPLSVQQHINQQKNVIVAAILKQKLGMSAASRPNLPRFRCHGKGWSWEWGGGRVPHECVFKSLRFHSTENAMKILRPHDRFHIVLPVHTETMKTTENDFNILLCKCRRRYLNLGA